MHISKCSNNFIPHTKGPCPTPWKAMDTFWRKQALESTRNSPTKINPLWAAKHHEWELRTPGSNLTSVKTLYSIVKIEIYSFLASFFLAPAASWLKSSHLQNCTTVLASNSNRSGFTFRVLSNQTDRDHSMEAHSESITLPPPRDDCGSHFPDICQVPDNFRPSEGHQQLSPFILIKSSIVTKCTQAEKWLNEVDLDPPLPRDLSGLNVV